MIEVKKEHNRRNFEVIPFENPVLCLGHTSKNSIFMVDKPWLQVVKSLEGRPVHRHIYGTWGIKQPRELFSAWGGYMTGIKVPCCFSFCLFMAGIWNHVLCYHNQFCSISNRFTSQFILFFIYTCSVLLLFNQSLAGFWCLMQ